MGKLLVARANATMLVVLTAFLLLTGLLAWDQVLATRSARGWVGRTWQVLATVKDLSIATRSSRDRAARPRADREGMPPTWRRQSQVELNRSAPT